MTRQFVTTAGRSLPPPPHYTSLYHVRAHFDFLLGLSSNDVLMVLHCIQIKPLKCFQSLGFFLRKDRANPSTRSSRSSTIRWGRIWHWNTPLHLPTMGTNSCSRLSSFAMLGEKIYSKSVHQLLLIPLGTRYALGNKKNDWVETGDVKIRCCPTTLYRIA